MKCKCMDCGDEYECDVGYQNNHICPDCIEDSLYEGDGTYGGDDPKCDQENVFRIRENWDSHGKS